MLLIPQEVNPRHHDRGDRTQSLYDLLRLVEPAHMGVTDSEIAIWLREGWILLDCKEEVWQRLIEALAEQVSGTDHVGGPTDPGARAEPQRVLSVLDRAIKLSGQ